LCEQGVSMRRSKTKQNQRRVMAGPMDRAAAAAARATERPRIRR